MPSIPTEEATLPYISDHVAADATLSPFTVSLTRGFLPRVEPPTVLPEEFRVVDSILHRMPILREDGEAGLLATGQFGPTILAELPDLTDAIKNYEHDQIVIGALYRDYSFLASAYLLEPCHLSHSKGQGYGLGRQRLPACIARPLTRSAELAGFAPFMEYAGSYALYNYRFVDPAKGFEYDNLRLIRAFQYGADPTSSEAGFILIHVAMVQHSGLLVTGVVDALAASVEGDREKFDSAMRDVVSAMREINKVMDRMWAKSKPSEYIAFRTFIFGIAKQKIIFPDGVIYEGVSEKPVFFRGESGANDSMIPLMDNLLQLELAQTPLTAILNDFRKYRPSNHRVFLEWVKETADQVGIKDYALQEASSAALYIHALDQVRDFRWRHWCFAREYILKQSKHPTATGGSPIVTWLPNQLQAVLKSIVAVGEMFPAKDDAAKTSLRGCQDVVDLARHQSDSLQKEVAKYCQEREKSAWEAEE